jgi:hypothetical protein
MKNLQTYEQYINETTPNYTFDGCELYVGSKVVSLDGYSGVIISKEITNGRITFRDNKGTIHICESANLVLDEMINEDLQWWEVTKGILAADLIKVGIGFAGGGLLLAGVLFNNWRNSIANKLDKIKSDKAYAVLKAQAEVIADKFNGDRELDSMLSDLQKYPYKDVTFASGVRAKNSAKQNNTTRSKLMRDISKYVKGKLTPEESKFFTEINKILRDKPLTDEIGNKVEEDLQQMADGVLDPSQSNQGSELNTDPNRTVGTGTYNPTNPDDKNVKTKAGSDTTDSASGGSHPVYVS